MRALLTALAMLFLTVDSADALANILCGEHDKVVSNLKRNYSEVPIYIGLGSRGEVIEILVAPSGTFTIIYTRPNGLSCIMAAGTDLEKTPPVEPGDPA